MKWTEAITLYAQWLRAGGRRPSTIRLRTRHLSTLSYEYPAGPWTVTPLDLVAWMDNPAWGAEAKKAARASIVTFYRWAKQMKFISDSPADILPPIHVPKRAIVPAPEDVINNALVRASQRDRLMLLLGSRLGLRRGEIAAIAWRDITSRSLLVRDGKGGRQRVLPLPEMLHAELSAEHERRSSGQLGTGWRYAVDPASAWVFPAQAGGHMSPDTVGAIIARCLRVVTAHSLRRRFATRAYEGTRDLRAVQELLGHTSPTTTARYIKVGDEDLRLAVEAAS